MSEKNNKNKPSVANRIGEAVRTEGFVSGSLTTVIIATVIVLNIIIFVIGNAFGLAFTVEEKDVIVLSGMTDDLFSSAIDDGKKVKISFCYPSREDVVDHVTGAFVHKTAEEYKNRYPDFIEIEYINIITGKNHKGENVDIDKYTTDQETGKQNLIARATVIFECENNYKVVTDTYSSTGFADFYTLDNSGSATSYNGEAFMAAMIHWVTVDEHPTAYFTMGHSEQVDSTFGNLLSMAGYSIDTVDLKSSEVPEDAALLIIANPISDFERAAEGSGTRSELERLNTYVERGGSIYVSLDPYAKSLPILEHFLGECGISFSETETEYGSLRNIIKDSRNAITTDGFTLVTEYSDDPLSTEIGERVERYNDGRVIIREAAALELSGNAKPLLVTTSSSTLEADGVTVDTSGSYAVAAYSRIEAKDDKTASVFVVPSIYLAVSDALITNGYSNRDFIFSLFEGLYGAEGMPYGCLLVRYDDNLLENLTMGTARLYTALILAVPAVLAVVGTVIVVKRKNR